MTCPRTTLALVLVTATTLAGNALGESGYGDSAPFPLNTASLSGVGGGGELPRVNVLGPCHPNPFNPATVISYELAAPATVRLAIYDLRGRLVRTLTDGQSLAAGRHEARWDGRDDLDATVSGGVYLYRITAGGFVAARSMTLLK